MSDDAELALTILDARLHSVGLERRAVSYAVGDCLFDALAWLLAVLCNGLSVRAISVDLQSTHSCRRMAGTCMSAREFTRTPHPAPRQLKLFSCTMRNSWGEKGR